MPRVRGGTLKNQNATRLAWLLPCMLRSSVGVSSELRLACPLLACLLSAVSPLLADDGAPWFSVGCVSEARAEERQTVGSTAAISEAAASAAAAYPQARRSIPEASTAAAAPLFAGGRACVGG